MNRHRSLIGSHLLGSLPPVEQLEDRTMLALLAPVLSSAWAINGTAANDSIQLRVSAARPNTIEAIVNGKVVATRSTGSITRIQIDGRSGSDNIRLMLGPKFAKPVFVLGGAGDDFIRGSAARDVLDGGVGNDRIEGDLGADTIYGRAGNDAILGGLDGDTLSGGSGTDQLGGGYGGDLLSGGQDADTVRGGDGRDMISGGTGANTLYYQDADTLSRNPSDTLHRETVGEPLQKVTDPDGLKDQLIDAAVKRWQYLFGQPHNYYPWYWYAVDGGGPAITGAPSANTSAPSSHSTTNVQVAGVDEADLVETNGQYTFSVRNPDTIVVMDSWPVADARIVARAKVEGHVTGIYLHEGTLTVISTVWEEGEGTPYPYYPAVDSAAPVGLWGGPWWGGKSVTKVTVLDVSNAENPTVVEETKLDGWLRDSRMIDSRLYLVVNDGLDDIMPIAVTNDDGTQTWETEAQFRQRMTQKPLSELLPKYTVRRDGQTITGSLIGEDLYNLAKESDLRNFFSVVMIDVADEDPIPDSSASVLGFSGEVYASRDNLYVTRDAYEPRVGGWGGELRTDIYKFSLGEESVDFVARGDVPGHVHNSFSLDESGDFLRIATTTSTGGLSNNVFIMHQGGDRIYPVGELTGLAFSERIFSARYIDDVLYLVTFRQVDPLFTIDLSDPFAPKVAGELKIPGFSTYLHPVGEGKLLGIGRDADETGRTRGLQVSLFDVSDIYNPRREAQYLITSEVTPPDGQTLWPGSTGSPAEHDHHAFSYFPEQGILAIPVHDWGWYNGQSRLELIRVGGPAGLSRAGRIVHTSPVFRSVQIDNFVYSLGGDGARIKSFDDLSTELKFVSFAEPTSN